MTYMNPFISVAIQVGSILFGFGAAYGLIKNKLEVNRDVLTQILSTLEKLDNGNRQSTIAEERQSIINSNFSEKLETLRDQVDVHAMAIKQIENEIIQIKTKCDYHIVK